MAIGVKVMQRPGSEASYVRATLKGMALTFRHLFRPKITMQYPEEKWTLPEYYRGVPSLVKDDAGREKCVACYMCATACPAQCIYIEAGEVVVREAAKVRPSMPILIATDVASRGLHVPDAMATMPSSAAVSASSLCSSRRLPSTPRAKVRSCFTMSAARWALALRATMKPGPAPPGIWWTPPGR